MVIVVPHTHWMDFIIGILVRSIVKERINYIAKKSLFKAPFGWFFRATGRRAREPKEKQQHGG